MFQDGGGCCVMFVGESGTGLKAIFVGLWEMDVTFFLVRSLGWRIAFAIQISSTF